MNRNYLVSVFLDGKNVNMYFSENLDDLVTIKALHKDCEITIYDMVYDKQFTPEQVDYEIALSRIRWKESLVPVKKVEKEVRQSQPKKRIKKYWSRPVKCVETGQVFPSIKVCSDHLGLSHKSIWNSINSGNARNGLHFVNVEKEELKGNGDTEDTCGEKEL